MIKKYCDLCKKQVEEFSDSKPTSGSLGELWSAAKVEDLCEKCFEKADKAKIKVQAETDKFFQKRMKELLKLEEE